MASVYLIQLVFIVATCKRLSHNVNYNGPFNNNNVERGRRLVVEDASASTDVRFYHGVASGDCTKSDVLIWTRVTPPFQDEWASDRRDIYDDDTLDALKRQYESIPVEWAISKSPHSLHFDCVDQWHCGVTSTSIDIDYTVKVVADGLAADTWYYYQFRVGDTLSDIGRTRTIPAENAHIGSWRMAFASCTRYAHGFFTPLADIARRDDLDMVVWLGDYIYELPNTADVNGTDIFRVPYPDTVLYTLDHYRKRFLQHHLDVDKQVLHRTLPWFMMWDDHEVANDYWKDGAPEQYHDDDLYGVNFTTRRANAYRAYFEWLPVTSLDVDARGGLYRSFAVGDLFDLIMVDAISQRTEPAPNTTYAATLPAEQHYSFGETQRNWMLDALQTSQDRGAKWRIFGCDDVWAQSPPPSVYNGREFFGEGELEGYDAERQIILDYIVEHHINNVVAMSAGPHTGIAQKVYSTGKPVQDDENSFPVIAEFVMEAIGNAKTKEESRYVPYVENYEREWSWVSPYIRFEADGYGIVTVRRDGVKVDFWVNFNTRDPSTRTALDTSICVEDGVTEFVQCDSRPTPKPPCPYGLTQLWFGDTAHIPAGYRVCDGSHGTPDLRDSLLIGAGSQFPFGASGGAASVRLTAAHLAPHSHDDGSLMANSDGSHSHLLEADTSRSGQHSHTFALETDGAGKHKHALTDIAAELGGDHGHTFDVFKPVDYSTAEMDEMFGVPLDAVDKQESYSTATSHANAHSHRIEGESEPDGDHVHSVSGSIGGDDDGSHSHALNANTVNEGEHEHAASGYTGETGQGGAVPIMNPFHSLYFICCTE